MVYLFFVSEIVTILPLPLGPTAKTTKRDLDSGEENKAEQKNHQVTFDILPA